MSGTKKATEDMIRAKNMSPLQTLLIKLKRGPVIFHMNKIEHDKSSGSNCVVKKEKGTGTKGVKPKVA